MSEKQLNEMKEKLTKVLNESYATVKTIVETNTKKLKLKSEIGQNKRDITKAYERLGEAFYNSVSTDTPLGDVEDILSLIDSKKKLNELLEEKLAALRSEDDEEAK